MPFADDDQLQWVEFQPAEELSLLTGDLCSFFGGCEECPGFTTVGLVRPGSPEIQTHLCSAFIGAIA